MDVGIQINRNIYDIRTSRIRRLFAGGTAIQLSRFEILDITDRGWDSTKYIVHDYEGEDRMKFYCNYIEVVAVEESDLLIE